LSPLWKTNQRFILYKYKKNNIKGKIAQQFKRLHATVEYTSTNSKGISERKAFIIKEAISQLEIILENRTPSPVGEPSPGGEFLTSSEKPEKELNYADFVNK
jgi:uncharacterized coiled-coil DUF342 family protein